MCRRASNNGAEMYTTRVTVVVFFRLSVSQSYAFIVFGLSPVKVTESTDLCL